ncbi:nuclear transport factor 2 family protein [Flavobacterium psychrotrophum]|uniref:nuclear transport factor 2 family protein n=1 Tax=Flavobacterium psychrotrophum TaxID=2294119 RepID=UPI0013C42469|nr:nuclear transport factor 2 family protein [Flavobacterium psychrotrophum]
MNVHIFINEWIAAGNAFDTEKYLSHYLPDAVLDDSSVRRKFIGQEGIRNYFESYFIGYNTNTELVHLEVANAQSVHVEVKFTGDFPEGEIGGTFDIAFKQDKISFIKADLI